MKAHPISRRGFLSLAAPALASGCVPERTNREPVVVTAWSNDRIKRFVESVKSSYPQVLSYRWIRVSERASQIPGRVMSLGPDFVIGLGAEACRRLAAEGVLQEWRPTSLVAPGFAFRIDLLESQRLGSISKWTDLAAPGFAGKVVFADPRTDSAALAACSAGLGEADWGSGYASLVRIASNALSVGLGSAEATLLDGRAIAGPALEDWRRDDPRIGFSPILGRPRVEGAGVVRGRSADAPSLDRLFPSVISESDAQPDPALGLIADLLGATLIDALPELASASRTLAGQAKSERLERLLTDPPAWPPASAEILMKSGDGPGGASLYQTLLAQLAPTSNARDWLRESWSSPPRTLAGELLGEIASAADGELARSPRFRSWLVAEWRAWARQRYRRVERLARAPNRESA